ncbi:ribonuclease Y [Spiroplasma sp. DGKH1]|uniref:ribonuclease Y n=1 Tax=Spiroplasma sp. DGKH1 TaxID=3050074 RepID=UPI0034C6C370
MPVYGWVILLGACALIFYLIGYLVEKYLRFKLIKNTEKKIKEAELTAKKIINAAKADAKVEAAQIRQDVREEVAQKRAEILENEKFFKEREKNIIIREEVLTQKEQELFYKREELQELLAKYDGLINNTIQQLEQIAGFSQDQAKDILFKEINDKYQKQIGEFLKNAEVNARLAAKETAVNIITQAIERYSADVVVEKTTAVINLADDNMKGRIIGKDGRNIKTFETTAGVDLIIDDTPNIVQVSSFNPIRREIAKKALERLITDGRIQPNKIEEAIRLEKTDLDTTILQTGKDTISELGIYNIDLELIRYIGMLKYRTSYGQNVLMHSIEVAKLAGIMASELGLDPEIAIRAGLLHDIGKAVDFENEGSHVTLGVQLATKYKESPIVINAIHSHHGEVPMDNPYSPLVAAADTLSAARPGGRNNTVENYISRMKELEQMCMEVRGVAKAYALQAGRQIRVIVNPERTTDIQAQKIAFDIREKISHNKIVPGDIVITVIRELRFIETVI